MVDGINLNPFTGKVFTDYEIGQLDSDHNGKVSQSELDAGKVWLSGGKDVDGEVAIDAPKANPVYDAVKKNGLTSPAAGQAELKESMTAIQDEYIEQYFQKNPNMEATDKAALIAFIKSNTTEFVNKLLMQRKAGPYELETIAADYTKTIEDSVAGRAKTALDVSTKIDNLKDNADANFDKLSSYTSTASKDYVKDSEFKEMKNQAVSYLMGKLLKGETDTDFLSGIDKNYAANSNFKAAQTAIKELQAEKDPVKAQALMAKAEAALSAFIGVQNADGTSKLQNGVDAKAVKKNDAAQTAKTEGYKKTIASINDTMVENMSNETVTRGTRRAKHTQEEIDGYAKTLTKIMDAFVAQYKGDGTNIERDYRTYAQSVLSEMDKVMTNVEKNITNSADKYAELKSAVGNVGSYASAGEKTNVVNQTVDFLFNEMIQGKMDISLLAEVYPNYASDPLFQDAKKLVEGFASSITRKEDLAKIKDLLTQLMNKVGADKLIDGVKNKKAGTVNLNAIDKEAFTSSVPGYDSNESVSTGRYRDRGDAMNDIQEQAKQKLESLRESLKSQLKVQMGADYDAAQVDEMISDAIYKTINQFTDMRVDKNGKHYSTDDAGFVTSKSGSKSRGVFNVKQLVDTFMTNLQNISAKESGEKDPTKNPVDRDDVLRDTSLANDYQDKKVRIYRDVAAAKLQIKTQLSIVANQLKSKLKQELGSSYDAATIDKLISQAQLNTLDTIGTKSMFFFKASTVNTADITNKFFDEFDKLYEESNKTQDTTKK